MALMHLKMPYVDKQKIERIIFQMILIFPISELAQNYKVPVNVVAMLL